jgi:hypothetical protein
MGVCNVCLYIVNRKMNFCVLDDSRPRGKLERTYSTNTVWDSGMGGGRKLGWWFLVGWKGIFG